VEPSIYVTYADDIRGPWAEPVDLGIRGYIDPGHVVGEDGRRYLFLSGVDRVRLTADGLATDGEIEPAYEGWRYPEDWVVEGFSLEGPKLLRRGEWFYLVCAVGGTAGPATGHMITVARSRSVLGPWEDDPANPLVRCTDPAQPWWSRGRWPRALGGELTEPLPMPAVVSGAQHGLPLSDDFAEASWGLRWSFDHPGRDEQGRAAFDGTGLVLQGNGSTPGDSSPMCVRAGDRAYVVEVELERLTEDAAGGLALFFNPRLYLGLHLDASGLTTYSGGVATWGREPVPAGVTRIGLRIENRHHIVTMWYRIAEGEWTQHSTRFETSGYHANTIQNLQSLRPALFATGRGSVRFRSFRYQALTE
jgi:beta-xylosidase